jgi:hypothetical protein
VLAESHLQRLKDEDADKKRVAAQARQEAQVRKAANSREVRELRLRLSDPAWRDANGIEALQALLRRINHERGGNHYISLGNGLALASSGFKSTWLECRYSGKVHLDGINRHTVKIESAQRAVRDVEAALEAAAVEPTRKAVRAGSSVRSHQIGFGVFAWVPLLGTLPAGDFFYSLRQGRRGKVSPKRHCPCCDAG